MPCYGMSTPNSLQAFKRKKRSSSLQYCRHNFVARFAMPHSKSNYLRVELRQTFFYLGIIVGYVQTSAVALFLKHLFHFLFLFSNRVEFPFPKETPFKSSSPWCKAANNPEYGFRCVVPASVKDKSFQRVFKRHSAKVRNCIQSDDISPRIFHFCVR